MPLTMLELPAGELASEDNDCGDAEVSIGEHTYRIVLQQGGPPEWWRRVEGRFADEVRWERCGDTEIPTARELTYALVAALERAEAAEFRGPRALS